MGFDETIENVGKAVDVLGVATMVAGIGVAAALALRDRGRLAGSGVYRGFRRRLGRAILLGLELLVAADIIRTVAISPTFESAGVLALIVAIRTFLSFALEVEIEGRWPWQKRDARPGTPTS